MPLYEQLHNFDARIVNLDVLTYAGNLDSLKDVKNNSRYTFIQEGYLRFEPC